jgi:hypothetical protein
VRELETQREPRAVACSCETPPAAERPVADPVPRPSEREGSSRSPTAGGGTGPSDAIRTARRNFRRACRFRAHLGTADNPNQPFGPGAKEHYSLIGIDIGITRRW